MAFAKFLIANSASAVVWALFYGLGAYYFGKGVEEFARPFAITLSVLGAVVVVAMIIYWRRKEQELAAAAERNGPGIGASCAGSGSWRATTLPAPSRTTITRFGFWTSNCRYSRWATLCRLARFLLCGDEVIVSHVPPTITLYEPTSPVLNALKTDPSLS